MIHVPLLLVPLLLSAPPAKLGVLGVSAPSELQAIANEVTLLLQQRAKSSGYEVVAAQLLREKMGEDAFAAAQGCLGKADCLARKLQGHPLERAVTGVLQRDEASYRLRLYLLQLSPPTLLSSSDRSIPIASRRFAREVAEMVPALLSGESEPLGTLHLTSNVSDVRAEVDGVSVGKLPVTLHPKPGKHLVRATKSNHLPVERWVTVVASRETTEQVSMHLSPGELTDAQRPGIEVAHRGGGVWLGRPWPFWVAAGVTALSAGTAAGFGMDASQRATRIERSYDPAMQVYQAPRSEALRGEQSAKMANTFLIVAGVGAAATAVTFFAMPAGGGSSQAQVWISPNATQPTVGIQGAF